MANSVDPDETPLSAASHLGLNCLLRPVCPKTYGKYGNWPTLANMDRILDTSAVFTFVNEFMVVKGRSV